MPELTVSTPKETVRMTRVFIVDDSMLLFERMSHLLSELPGIEVVGQARSPKEAMRAIETLTPDVVILDMHLIGGSGLEVLKDLEAKNRSGPKVIVLTNYAYDEYRKKCLATGAHAFLDKTTEFGKVPDLLAQLS